MHREPASGQRLPVAVVLECELARSGQWRFPRWRLAGALVGDEARGKPGCQRILEQEGRTQYLWRGLWLTLYRDSAEGYWYNLGGASPALFVVAREDEDGAPLRPVLVTANQDEAGAHMETDDNVFSMPMDAALREWVERFVAVHYTPPERKKRKRANWSSEEETREKPRARRPLRDA